MGLNHSTDRLIAFPGFFDRATAHYDGGTGQIFGEMGYGFALANLAVEPFAGAAWVRVHADGGAEQALVAGLNFAATTFEVAIPVGFPDAVAEFVTSPTVARAATSAAVSVPLDIASLLTVVLDLT